MNANEMAAKFNPWLNRIQASSVYLRNVFLVSTVVFGVIGLLGFGLCLAGVYPPISYPSNFWAWSDALECWFAYKLFSYYVSGDFFVPQAVGWMRWIGILSLLRGSWNMWNTFHLHLHDGYFGHVQSSPILVQIVLYLDLVFSQLLHNLFFGCVIIFIAGIMDEGRKIREEQELTV